MTRAAHDPHPFVIIAITIVLAVSAAVWMRAWGFE